ncbi:hypothetical protein BaRGS_00027543, partial [Batillaria attramentaria]
WCQQRKWRNRGLLLALSQGQHRKVSIYEYTYLYRGEFAKASIKAWIRQTLRKKFDYVKDMQHVKTKWLNIKNADGKLEYVARAVFAVRQDTLPIQFFARGVQCSPEVKFGIMKNSLGPFVELIKDQSWPWQTDFSLPFLLLVTEEGTYVYGQNPGECFECSCIETFLGPWHPSFPYVAYALFVLTVLLALFEVFFVDNFSAALCQVLWSASLNIFIFFVLLGLLLDGKSYPHSLEENIHRIIDSVGLRVIRMDFIFFRQHPYVFAFLSLAAFGLLPTVARRLKVLPPKPNTFQLAQSNFNAPCGICLDDMTTGQHLCSLPCGHTFHGNCTQGWRRGGGSTCPFCRINF